MKKLNRILAMLLIAVFAFSQLPMAALAAEEASGHDAVTSDTHDTGGDGGGSEPDMGSGVAAFGMTMMGEGGEESEGGEEGDEGSASREVATWDAFKAAIADTNIEVVTITYNLDADKDSDPITINRTVRITSDDEYTVDLKGASIEVVSGGSLTLDGALVLQGNGEKVIEVQAGGVTAIKDDVKIEADWLGVLINGGTVNIDGGTISGAIGVYVKDGTVTIGDEAEITATGIGTGVYVKGGTVTIKDDVKIKAIAEGVGVYGGNVNIEGGTITAAEIGVYIKGGETTISGGTITATGEWGKGVNVEAGGTATISGGTITATGDGGNGVRGGEGGTVNIGGEAKISATYANTDRSTGVLAYNSTVTIKDDVKIEAYDYGVWVDGGTVTISGEAEITGTEEYSTGVRVLDGDGVSIGGNAKISNGISVEGGTVNIGGEAKITETFSYKTCISIQAGGTVNIGGGAEVLATGERSDGISIQVGGTVNIGGEAEVSATGKNSNGISVQAGERRSKGVSVLEGSGVNIGGNAKISATDTCVGVEGGTVNIGGEAEILVTGMLGSGVYVKGGEVTISGGTITGTEVGVRGEGCTVTISGGTITGTVRAVGVKSCKVTISGGTITGVDMGILVEHSDVVTINGGTITATGIGVGAVNSTINMGGGAITVAGEDGVNVIGGNVNIISSAGFVINGGIYNGVVDEYYRAVFFELLKNLPTPISVWVGQKTAEFTLNAGAGVTFQIDNDNTSNELAAEIDTNNKVTLTLPEAVGIYNLVLNAYLEGIQTNLKLTIPVAVTVKPQSGGSGGTSMPTIPAAGGAAKVSYTASGGTLFLQMPSTKVNEIIEKSGDSAAEFDLSRAGSATAARLPGDALSSFAQAGLDVTLRLPTGTMTLSSAAAASVATQATDENVRIELQQAAAGTLTDAQKAAVGSGDLVLDINIYSGTQKISNFDGTLAMAVPYDGPLPVAVWYLSNAGELERLDCTFENGIVHFTLDHLSLYVVGQDTEWQNPFADLKESSWYYDAVAFIAQKGITAGTTATTFSPDATLTRGQFITMLLRAYEIAPDDGAADNFADAGDSYYTGYLAAAKRLGIANGVGDNQFAPEQAITRQEMFTLLYNALGVLDRLPTGDIGKTLPDFADSDAIADWAREALAVLVECGIVSGSGGRLEPTATTTRAQMAQVMYNLLGK